MINFLEALYCLSQAQKNGWGETKKNKKKTLNIAKIFLLQFIKVA